MTDIALSILAFIAAISVLVAVHEFGHYWVARRLGFKVLRFSIGFGQPLLRWRGKDADRVEYWISAIPLGGYVKMLDERESPVPAHERHRAFNNRPIPHRIAVLLAGPGFNFLFAIVAYWAMFVAGVPGLKPVIGAVAEGSVAAEAGVRADDMILSVGGRPTETLDDAMIAMLDDLLADARLDLVIRDPRGDVRSVELDVTGREAELTAPGALFSGIGIRPGPVMPAVIAGVEPGMAADQAGLAAGDRVLAADGQAIDGWEPFVEFVRKRPGESITLTVQRSGERLTIPVTLGGADENGTTVGRIGASRLLEFPPESIEALLTEQSYGVLESLRRGLAKTWEMSALTVRMLVRMVVGDVSVKNISGPISIAEFAGDSAQAGFNSFLHFLAVVSISLGVLNLIPIPLLDGGQVAYQLAEAVKGRPLSERALILGQQVGVFLLIVLMSFVFYNDITRMFS